MTGRIDARLQELGITLPTPPAPVASYVPFVIVGNVVHVSGQVSVDASGGIKGKLGDQIEVEEGQAAARGFHLRQQIERAEARGSLTFLHFDLVAQLALDPPARVDRNLA